MNQMDLAVETQCVSGCRLTLQAHATCVSSLKN
jgi:hypothetical protein